jgi:hypothetical protein
MARQPPSGVLSGIIGLGESQDFRFSSSHHLLQSHPDPNRSKAPTAHHPSHPLEPRRLVSRVLQDLRPAKQHVVLVLLDVEALLGRRATVADGGLPLGGGLAWGCGGGGAM